MPETITRQPKRSSAAKRNTQVPHIAIPAYLREDVEAFAVANRTWLEAPPGTVECALTREARQRAAESLAAATARAVLGGAQWEDMAGWTAWRAKRAAEEAAQEQAVPA